MKLRMEYLNRKFVFIRVHLWLIYLVGSFAARIVIILWDVVHKKSPEL